MHARTGSAAAALCIALLAVAPAAAVAAPATPAADAALVDGASADDRALLVHEVAGAASRLHDLAPGDSVMWAAEVTNATASGAPVIVDLEASGDGRLVDDPRDGLQLDVMRCDDGFAAVADDRPLRCRGPVQRLGAGPAATLGRLDTSIPLDPGESTSVGVRVSFPSSAGDDAESTTGALRVTFSLLGSSGPGPAPVDPAPQAAGPDDDPRRGRLPVTGRDIASALSGALLTLALGAVLLLASRRRDAERSGSALPPEAQP